MTKIEAGKFLLRVMRYDNSIDAYDADQRQLGITRAQYLAREWDCLVRYGFPLYDPNILAAELCLFRSGSRFDSAYRKRVGWRHRWDDVLTEVEEQIKRIWLTGGIYTHCPAGHTAIGTEKP